MKTIELKTCNHLGDTLCLTAVMANAQAAMPDENTPTAWRRNRRRLHR